MIYPWAVLFINLSLAVVLNKYLNLNISILIPILLIILSFVFNGIIRFLVLNLAIFLLGINISHKEKPVLQINQPIFVECVVSSFPDYTRFGSKFDCKVINSSEKQLIGKTFPVFAKYEENIYFLSRIAFLGKAKEKDGNLILMSTKYFLKVDNSDNFLYPILKYRENCISNYRQNAISYETFQVGSALIFGENRYLDLQAKKPFYQTGLAHLIAVSGSHIAILFLSLSFILFFLSERKRLTTLGLILPVYGVLTGIGIPAVRAVFMSLLYIISKLFYLKNNSLNILFFTAFIFAFFDPESLFSVSFQLSFLAVFGIILTFEVFKDLENWQKVLISSLFATLFTLPVILYYFGNFSPTTIFATPIASLPLYPLLTISVLNLLTGFEISFLVKIMDFFTLIFIQIVKFFSSLGLYFTGFSPSIWLIFIYLAILTFILIYDLNKTQKIVLSATLAVVFLIFSKSDLSPKIYVFENKVYPVVLFTDNRKCYLFADFESKKILNIMNKEGCEYKVLLTEKREKFSDEFSSEFDIIKDFTYQISFENIHYKKWINPILTVEGKVFELKNQDLVIMVNDD